MAKPGGKTKTKSKTGPSGATGHGASFQDNFSGNSSAGQENQDRQQSGSGVVSKATGLAHEAADTVMSAASKGASSLSRQVTEMLDRQVSSGADMIGQVARSTRLAADELDGEIPQVAGVVRTVADTIDGYADSIRYKSAEELLGSASDFARRQPMAVFGVAALAGFLAFRAFRSGSDRSDESRGADYQSGDPDYQSGMDDGFEADAFRG